MLEKVKELMDNKEVLTQEERDLVHSIDPKFSLENLFHNPWDNTYLNLNVYSEVEKERYDLQKEMGY